MTDYKGLYIHIPFCDFHCHYCSFLTFMANPDRVAGYVDYLLEEIDLYKRDHYHLDTIYFGGGTPSVLTPDQISTIMAKLHEVFDVSSDAEITMEMNPESVTADKVKAAMAGGVNRISLGVQSFNNEVLEIMGRLHREDMIYEKIDLINGLGINNISIDLMFNNPKQTREVLERDLELAMQLDIQHMSIYSLMIEKNTQYERWIKRKSFEIEEDEEEREMYYLIQRTLKDHGFNQYEISNFARPGYESQHNQKYWHQEDYIGMGLGASGNLGNVRYDNQDNFIHYFKDLDQGRKPVKETYELTKAERESEFIMLNMRLIEGMSISQVNREYDIDFLDKYKDIIDKHLGTGLIALSDDRIYFTPKGLDLSNQFYLDIIH